MGRPPEEPEQPLTENSLLEVLDGTVMMYNLSVHQQLGKVLHCQSMFVVRGVLRGGTHECFHACLLVLVHTSISHSKTLLLLLPGSGLYCFCQKRPSFGNFASWVETVF